MIRVRVVDEPWSDGVAIYVIRYGERSREVRTADGRWQAILEAQQAEPTFRIGEDEARALLEALIRSFEGAEDTRQLRKDYEAERLRVDKFIDALVLPRLEIGRGPAK